jgi:hypothetical protein
LTSLQSRCGGSHLGLILELVPDVPNRRYQLVARSGVRVSSSALARICPWGSLSACIMSTPIRRCVCCPRAASGHAAAEPTIPLIKLRVALPSPRLGITPTSALQSRSLQQGNAIGEIGLNGLFCAAAILSRSCLLRVKSRALASRACLLPPAADISPREHPLVKPSNSA